MADPVAMPGGAETSYQIFEYDRVLVPVFCVFLGYALKNFEIRQSNTDERIEEVSKEIAGVVEVSLKYWSKSTISRSQSEEDIAMESEIQGRIHVINAIFESISKKYRDAHADYLRNIILGFRQVLTGGNFASSSGHEASANVISNIFITSSNLRVGLMNTAKRKYFS